MKEIGNSYSYSNSNSEKILVHMLILKLMLHFIVQDLLCMKKMITR